MCSHEWAPWCDHTQTSGAPEDIMPEAFVNKDAPNELINALHWTAHGQHWEAKEKGWIRLRVVSAYFQQSQITRAHTHTQWWCYVSHSNVPSTDTQLFPSLSALVREESFVTFTTLDFCVFLHTHTNAKTHWLSPGTHLWHLLQTINTSLWSSINSSILCQELCVSLNITQLYQTFQISYRQTGSLQLPAYDTQFAGFKKPNLVLFRAFLKLPRIGFKSN